MDITAHHLTCFPPMVPLEPVASQNPQHPGHSSFPSLAGGQTPAGTLASHSAVRIPGRNSKITNSGSAEGQIRSPHHRGILQPASGSRSFPSQLLICLLLHFAELHSRLFSSQGSGLAGGVSHPIPPSLCRRASQERPGEGKGRKEKKELLPGSGGCGIS